MFVVEGNLCHERPLCSLKKVICFLWREYVSGKASMCGKRQSCALRDRYVCPERQMCKGASKGWYGKLVPIELKEHVACGC